MSNIHWGWKKVVVFILLTFGISSIFYASMSASGSSRDLGVFWMWSPAVAALLTQLFFHGNLRCMGWAPPQKKYLFWGLLVPFIYASIIYSFAWITGLALFKLPTVSYLLFLPIGLVAACLAALGEEIGWRGLLLPELARLTTFPRTVLITWIVWSVWHFPVILFADYHSLAPRWFDLTTLTISVLGLSSFTTWLRFRSSSLWPVVLWHGAHNLFMQEAFIHMSIETPLSRFVIDDFGIGLVIVSLVLGFVCWRKRLELSQFFRQPMNSAGYRTDTGKAKP